MYNPAGSDNNKEYVEVYSKEFIDLNGYIIEDSSSSDILTSLFYCDCHYSLIVEEGFSYSNINASIYSVGATIGNNLNNDGDIIILKDNSNNIIDALSYSSSWGANGNNQSLCRIPDGDGIWQECQSTPGEENNLTSVDYVIDGDTFVLTTGERVRLIGIDTPETGEYYYTEAKDRLTDLVEGKQIILESDVEDKDVYGRLLRYVYLDNTFINLVLVKEGFARAYPYEPNIKYEDEFADAEEIAQESGIGIWLFSQYTSLKINEFLPNPNGYDDAPMPDGEWVELYNSGDIAIDVEGLILNDDYGKGLTISEVNVLDSMIIQSNSFIVIYRNGNGRLELNNDGFDKVKLLIGETVIDEVSYDGSKEGLSWSKSDDGWKRTIPTPVEENNIEEAEETSNLEIEKIYLGSDDKAKFGDTLRVKVMIYKGDTDKYSVKLWLEDDETDEAISKKTSVNIYDKFTNNTLTLPVQIDPNCKRKFKDGYYDLVLSGLDSADREEIKVEGITTSLCEKVYTTKSTTGNFFYEVLELPAEVTVGKEFTTKLEIKNNLSEERFVKVWSYVYKGRTSVSGEREENLQAVRISAESSKILELKNTVKETEAGDYKFKIKIERDDRKTLKEITKDIRVLGAFEAEVIEKAEAQAEQIERVLNMEKITSAIVYESKEIKAERMAIYFFSFVLILVIVYFMVSKKI